ncbi:MAG TPA: RNA-binding protein [Candidatus Bathyarchaeia archaeon]|nr:RNA-binding protein [Candidatus Bathyarchaeia archaeon]
MRMSNILVGNLTGRTTEADICALFELYGEVQGVALVKDPLSGNSCGFAFVHMPNPTDARDAILSVNHSILGGHSLRVEATRKAKGSSSVLSGSRLVRPGRG